MVILFYSLGFDRVVVDKKATNQDKNFGYWSVFKSLNADRKENHSANRIYRNEFDHIVGVRCNCCKKTYHPVVGGRVKWDVSILRAELNQKMSLGRNLSPRTRSLIEED